jgi:hypothetical protein
MLNWSNITENMGLVITALVIGEVFKPFERLRSAAEELV